MKFPFGFTVLLALSGISWTPEKGRLAGEIALSDGSLVRASSKVQETGGGADFERDIYGPPALATDPCDRLLSQGP